MSGRGGIGQLFKGVVIGIVLLLAIIGTTSILDKGKNKDTSLNTTSTEQSPQAASISAPTINMTPDNTTDTPPLTPPLQQ